ncbi:HU family DNA-binding protein [Acidisphaera sp. L21]|uniref:HU family DNA-binding protein n=1 Tax=Acidisphaera sp. L21 TaxID=1641851 RepID=UPI00131E8D98|nr:HU family DNA-binding protein [Acidisphaera sp. L21]
MARVATAKAPSPATKASAVSKPSPKATAATKVPAKTAVNAKSAKVVAPVKAQTVTLKQMATAFSEQHATTNKDAQAILTDVFDRVVSHLKAGDRVRIAGLGIIEVKDRPARMGRNPATGEAVQIKASRKIAFRAAKELKAAI